MSPTAAIVTTPAGTELFAFGAFFVTAAFNRDYTMVLGTVMFFAVLIVGRLLGPAGLLVAVPMLAVVMVLVRKVLIEGIYGDEPRARAVACGDLSSVTAAAAPSASSVCITVKRFSAAADSRMFGGHVR